ncbi:MAG: SpoIIE family protein phosphatase [Actinomycetota bacterium]|nr:SpoIIE family protein phosphatase [Actinomycetota bacterium]
MSTGDDDVVDGFIEALLDDDAQTLYERAPCGYLSTTPDGTIIKANATFLTLTGYSREDLVGRKRFVDLLTGGGQIYHETHYAPMLRMHGIAREIALDLVCADTRRRPILVNSVLERDDSGSAVVIRTAVFDATDRRRYEQELLRQTQRATSLAKTLQQTLIPPHVPSIDGLQVAAEYRPAGDGTEVGGDFYDIFQTDDESWVITIGDVRGKGAEAAVVTALARYTLRAAAVQDPSPARGLLLLNDALKRADVDRFCTAAMLRLTRLNGMWQLSSCAAGHPLPLHVDTSHHVTSIGRPGTLLGVLSDPTLIETAVTLAPGDIIVTYTDGVVDARALDGSFYGDQRLLTTLQATSGTARDIAASLLADVLNYQSRVARDDIAIVAVRVPD